MADKVLEYVIRKNKILKSDRTLLKICYKVWVLKYNITLNEKSQLGGYYPDFFPYKK